MTSRAAFDLGWDFASFCGMILPSSAGPEMEQGYQEGLRRLAGRQKHHDRFDRKWLLLRMNAINRGREFSQVITPDYLRKIDAAYCPVTFEPLTHGECTESDWSVDRVLNDGAYADGNLVIISARVNKAKAAMNLDEITKAAEYAITSMQGTYRGLAMKEWARVAALSYGPHYVATGEYIIGPQFPEFLAGPAQRSKLHGRAPSKELVHTRMFWGTMFMQKRHSTVRSDTIYATPTLSASRR